MKRSSRSGAFPRSASDELRTGFHVVAESVFKHECVRCRRQAFHVDLPHAGKVLEHLLDGTAQRVQLGFRERQPRHLRCREELTDIHGGSKSVPSWHVEEYVPVHQQFSA